MRWLRRIAPSIGLAVDHLFSGRWWWVAARDRAEARLAHALERHGERSIQARRAAQHCLRMDFAVRYWRNAIGPVMKAVELAEASGASRADLQLIVLNRDLRVRRGVLRMRPQGFLRRLSVFSAAIVATQWALLMALTFAASGSLPRKVVAFAAITAIYGVLYRGWTLFTSRPVEAVARSGPLLEQCARELGQASISAIPVRTSAA